MTFGTDTSFIKIVFSNLIGFDGIIIILILFNLIFVMQRLRRLSNNLNSSLKQVVYLPIKKILDRIMKEDKLSNSLHELQQKREKENVWHQIYITITGILPLMGILGTVISLLKLIDMNKDLLQINFTAALTSTFWGLTGAIICKALEGVLTPNIENNQESMRILLERIDRDGGDYEA
jgi:flagellar motor component MotA